MSKTDLNGRRAHVCQRMRILMRDDSLFTVKGLLELVQKIQMEMREPVFAAPTPDSSLRASLDELDLFLGDFEELMGDVLTNWDNIKALLKHLSDGFEHDSRTMKDPELRMGIEEMEKIIKVSVDIDF